MLLVRFSKTGEIKKPANSPGKKTGPANSGLLDSPLGTNRGQGAMVDIGLGPTYGITYFELFATKQSPRRVQTDAYHRPCVLNYHP